MKKRYILVLATVVVFAILFVGYWGILRPYYVKKQYETQISLIHEHWKQTDYSKVIELSDKLLSINPDNTDIILLRSFAQFNYAYLSATTISQIQKEEIWEAIHAIRKAQAIDLTNKYRDVAYYMLGKCYFVLSRNYISQSIDYLQKALYNGYKPDDIYEFLSAALVQSNRTDESISLLTNLINKKPKLSVYLALIDMYLDTQDIENGTKIYELAAITAQTEQERLAVQLREARIATAKNNVDTAMALLQNIVKTFPQSAEAHYYLGNIYEQLGDESKARYEWRLAYKMSPYWDKVIAKLDSEINY